ncbi:hypothetical protein CJ999_32180 [Bacillus thuringiensis]|nr:hypothetical protein AC241_30145 [Bacillus thuringiensis]MBZ8125978.1 hypothetical protein [Bacillus thuringiensis]
MKEINYIKNLVKNIRCMDKHSFECFYYFSSSNILKHAIIYILGQHPIHIIKIKVVIKSEEGTLGCLFFFLKRGFPVLRQKKYAKSMQDFIQFFG